jgi:23S rRNA pseudouridine1911/1915/1917 synthase
MRITVTAKEAGTRLDKLLVSRLTAVGRTQVKRLFDEERVHLVLDNERGQRMQKARKGDVCVAGQVFEVGVQEETSEALPEADATLEVLLETDQIVVVEKPAGQPSAPLQPGERGALANALLGKYPEMKDVGFSVREPGLCHRLDTATSGLLVAARSKAAFEAITKGLKEHRLDKKYLLLCPAKDLPESGIIDIPLAPHPKDKKRMLACIHERDQARNAPKPATTAYKLVRTRGDIALVEATAPSARRHQIRCHFAAIGHPLYGDALYRGAALEGLERHALHAHRIAWPGDSVVPAFVVTSQLPEDLARLCPEREGPEKDGAEAEGSEPVES